MYFIKDPNFIYYACQHTPSTNHKHKKTIRKDKNHTKSINQHHKHPLKESISQQLKINIRNNQLSNSLPSQPSNLSSLKPQRKLSQGELIVLVEMQEAASKQELMFREFLDGSSSDKQMKLEQSQSLEESSSNMKQLNRYFSILKDDDTQDKKSILFEFATLDKLEEESQSPSNCLLDQSLKENYEVYLSI